jgi:hypothetical protein
MYHLQAVEFMSVVQQVVDVTMVFICRLNRKIFMPPVQGETELGVYTLFLWAFTL